MTTEPLEEAVIVSLRVRPLLERDLAKHAYSVVQQVSLDPKIVMAGDRGMAFDHIFIDSDQKAVYEEMMHPIVDRFLLGINCTVLAYGQTGTGKTYTMGTEAKNYGTPNDGLIFRAMETILSSLSSNSAASFTVSFIEIYNEEVYDLLLQQPMKLDSRKLKFKAQGVSCIPVETLDDVVVLFARGASNRHTRATALNDSSSRSHAIFTVYFSCSSGDHHITSKLNLVDLAGSEGVRKTGNEGQARQEGISINQGLLALGNVIQILSSKTNVHVPYRNSILTSILQDCLQERNMVAVIACVSPSVHDLQETVNTMRFAEKAQKVIYKSEVNQVVTSYKAEHSSKFAHMGSAIKKIPPTPACRNNGAYAFVTPAPVPKRKPLSELNSSISPSLSVEKSGELQDNEKSVEKSGELQDNKNHQLNERLSNSSILSYTMADISTSSRIMPSTLSPLVPKCCQTIEHQLDDKIATIVRNQLKRPSVKNWWSVTSQDQDSCLETSNECLPTTVRKKPVPQIAELNVNLKEARDEIDLMKDQLKSEIRHFVKNEVFEVLNTSMRRCMPLTNEEDHLFDVADVRCRLEFPINTVTSPIGSKSLLRRSVRLMTRPDVGNKSLLRRSVRLETRPDVGNKSLLRRNVRLETRPDVGNKSLLRRSVRLETRPDVGNKSLLRRSVRLMTRPDVGITPKKPEKITNKERVKPSRDKVQENSSTQQEHNEWVLSILNSKTSKEIEILPTIGCKTALIIFNYRRLNGSFNSLEDLGAVPGLPKSYFSRFILANNILF